MKYILIQPVLKIFKCSLSDIVVYTFKLYVYGLRDLTHSKVSTQNLAYTSILVVSRYVNLLTLLNINANNRCLTSPFYDMQYKLISIVIAHGDRGIDSIVLGNGHGITFSARASYFF